MKKGKWVGKTYKGGGCEHRTLFWYCEDGRRARVPCCMDLRLGIEPDRGKIGAYQFDWGYEGEWASLLAQALLGFHADHPMTGAKSHMKDQDHPGRSYLQELMEWSNQSARRHKALKLVEKHYQAFTSEVIANLPDNWEMTMEDIDAWVKGRERNEKMDG